MEDHDGDGAKKIQDEEVSVDVNVTYESSFENLYYTLQFSIHISIFKTTLPRLHIFMSIIPGCLSIVLKFSLYTYLLTLALVLPYFFNKLLNIIIIVINVIM